MSEILKTIVVDDEPLARKRLTSLLEDEENIEVIGTCANGKEAIKAIRKEQPDLVFLDVQMPEVNGFEVLKNIGKDDLPAIVFVTAYDEYAVKAFEVNAIDYLLKPFKEDRFKETLHRVQDVTQKAARDGLHAKVSNLLDNLDGKDQYIQRLMVKSSDRYFFIKAEEIDSIESAGNYVQVHSGDKKFLIRETMKNMEAKLNPEVFFRVHRSTIVNVNKIKELEKWFHGDYKIVMKSGEELTMSRNYKELLSHF